MIKKTIPKIFTLIILISQIHFKETNSFFTNQYKLTNTLTAGVWSTDLILGSSISPPGLSLNSLFPASTLFTSSFSIEEETIDPISISAFFDNKTNQLTTNFSSLPSNFGNHYLDYLEYEIIYVSAGLDKGIAGKILPSQVSPNYDYQVTHFLGTCTSLGEVCNPDLIDDGTITIKLLGLVNNFPISIIKSVCL